MPAAGNSSSTRSYSFTHNNSGAGSHFYRLRMVDADGKFTFFNIRILNFGMSKKAMLLFPNPVTATATLTGAEAGDILRIISTDGRTVNLQKATGNTTELNATGLTPGIYALRVLQQVKDVFTLKFTKH